jgi:hypothetical protein
MIVVYVEEWPDGDQERANPLGSLALHDITKPGDLLGNFAYEIDEAPNPSLGVPQLRKTGQVPGHNHRQSVWRLVRRAIDSVWPPLVTP